LLGEICDLQTKVGAICALQFRLFVLLSRHCLRCTIPVRLLVVSTFSFAAWDNTAPSSGRVTTCSKGAPNPMMTPVTAVAGSINVTVNILSGAELDITNQNAVFVRDQSFVSPLA
jgi:hypothetical protein